MEGNQQTLTPEALRIFGALRVSIDDLRRELRALKATNNRQDQDRHAHNIIVFGRATTNVLQNLRGKVAGFDEWYAPWRLEMSSEPLLRYLYESRSEILKQGTTRIRGGRTHIKSSQMTGLSMEGMPPPPEGAVGVFIGDQEGRSGWIVQRSDGTEEEVYVDMPTDKVRVEGVFANAPLEYFGTPLHDHTPLRICALYILYLDNLVLQATKRFGATE